MSAALALRMREDDWNALHKHLFPGDGDEHGAVLLCGRAGERLLVREVVMAEDGTDYVPGTRGYRHLTGEFVTRQLRRAKDLGLVYLAVHNHGGRHHVAFSASDMASHERAYPTLLSVSTNAVGALVVAQGAVAGDVWLPDGTRATLARTDIIGRSLVTMTEGRPGRTEHDARYSRQALMFGDDGQALLRNAKVGVVGAGGVGMLLVQAIARLGVGEIVVIDPERVEVSNLSRLPEATRWDALEPLDREGRPALLRLFARRFARRKVKIASRLVRRASLHTRVNAIVGDVADDAVARTLLGCDFIFLAADSMLARDVVNQIAYQYVIPTLQVGSKAVLDSASGTVLDVFSVVRSLGMTPGCLRCNGLIDTQRLSEEALGNERQRRNQRYVDDPDISAPSVITLNAVGASWAANEFLQYIVGLGTGAPAFRIFRNRPVSAQQPQLTVQFPANDAQCHVCGRESGSAMSRGDGVELPTRLAF